MPSPLASSSSSSSRSPRFISLLAASSLGPFLVAAAESTSSLPEVDYGKLGSVALGGSFTGLDFYDVSSQPANITYSVSASTLVARNSSSSSSSISSSSSLTPLVQTEEGGRILALCWLDTGSGGGGSLGTLFVGGEFASLGGVQSRNFASVDALTGQVSSLGQGGVEGVVEALYCDGDGDGGEGESGAVVWLGGAVTSPVGSSTSSSQYGRGVIRYSPSSSSFSPAPFVGFSSGSVSSITPSPSGASLLFTGDFVVRYLSMSSTTNSTTNSTTTTTTGGFSPTGLPLSNVTITSPGATAFSSSLSPIPLLGPDVLVDAGPTTTLSGFQDPNVLFCPSQGQAWLARDVSIAQINLILYREIVGSGLRLGNALVNGRGTTTFQIISIPDNTILTLTYRDPASQETKTCSDECPLSVDSNVPYQDFLFQEGGRQMTGFQIQLLGWQGEGAGLSQILLLSDGSFASAVSEEASACASIPSSTAAVVVGQWEEITVDTSIGGTTGTALQTKVPVSQAATIDPLPAVTFYPTVTGTGNYSVSLVLPGCNRVGDCATRTSLDVIVFPYQNASSWTQTVPPTSDDVEYLVYNGAIQASSSSFTPTVRIAMSRTPTGVNGDEYSIVINRVELKLTSLDTTGLGSGTSQYGANGITRNGTTTITPGSTTNTTTTTNTTAVALGVYEWVHSSSSSTASLDASKPLANSTETAFDKLGAVLASSLGGSSVSATDVSASAFVAGAGLLAGRYYVAGAFSTSAFSNIVAYDNATLSALPELGLNGFVNALLVMGSKLYVGGEFTRTQSGNTALAHLASYDPATQVWSTLAGGVDGPVSSLTASTSEDGKTTTILVAGNFSTLLAANSSSSSVPSGGFAVWDVTSNAWVADQSVVFGDVAITAGGFSGAAFFAGRISGTSGFGARGFATISQGSDGQPQLSTVPLSFAGSSTSGSALSSRRRRSAVPSTKALSPWLSLSSSVSAFRWAIVKRQSTTTGSSGQTAPAIPLPASVSPSILAAAYWKNTTASSSPLVTVVGGNFSTTSGASNLAIYMPSSKATIGLPGNEQVDGVVRTLLVDSDRLFVGGEFALSGTGGSGMSGLGLYDLKAGRWVTDQMAGLVATSSNVSVSALVIRGDTNTFLAAGSFDRAGSLPCASVCAWDTSTHQWSALDDGLNGEVRVLEFAGAKSDTLFAAGSFVMPASGDIASVARYSFTTAKWESVGSLPGPATALAVDNKNASNVFAAGISSLDGSPYLRRWDGSSWSTPPQANLLQASSSISQLSFIPLKVAHAGNPVMENDRMLLVSGAFTLGGDDAGRYSSALYDGAGWHPYVRATGSDGGAGSLAGLFASERSFSFNIRKFLASGIVVLICIAIATGLIFLFVLLIVLIALWRRRSDERNSAQQADPKASFMGRDSFSDHHARGSSPPVDRPATMDRTPSVMLKHINLATAGVISGGAGLGAPVYDAQHEKRPSEITGVAAGPQDRHGDAADEEEEDEELEGRIVHARWSLVPEQGAERELPLKAGQEYLILNDSDDEWWLAVDLSTGEQGAVPAAWML